MSWPQFAHALPQLARTRGCPAQQAVAKVAACPGPQLNSEAGGSGRQSSFTGRSGSWAGSRAPSQPSSEAGSLASERERGERDDDSLSVSSQGRVGAFTPTRRASGGGGTPSGTPSGTPTRAGSGGAAFGSEFGSVR